MNFRLSLVLCEACTESCVNLVEPGSKPGPMRRLWREERSVERELVEELLHSHAAKVSTTLGKMVRCC